MSTQGWDPALRPTFLLCAQCSGLTVNLGYVTTTLHSDTDVHTSKSLLAQEQNRFQ